MLTCQSSNQKNDFNDVCSRHDCHRVFELATTCATITFQQSTARLIGSNTARFSDREACAIPVRTDTGFLFLQINTTAAECKANFQVAKYRPIAMLSLALCTHRVRPRTACMAYERDMRYYTTRVRTYIHTQGKRAPCANGTQEIKQCGDLQNMAGMQVMKLYSTWTVGMLK